ncbi:MAG: TraU family protein [Campylobacterales bacterium]|nr:TraU family protein [Campylobacterales bacterium]
MLNKKFFHTIVFLSIFFSSSSFGFDAPALTPHKWFAWDFVWDHTTASADICYCMDNQPNVAGFKASLVEPIALIDVTPRRFNFPSWGFDLGKDSPTEKVGNARGKGAFRHTHTTRYPLMSGLNFINMDTFCYDIGSFDLGSLSEIKPWRNSDYLSLLTPANMVKAFFDNVVAELAVGAIDCPSTSVLDKPVNSLYYGAACAGTVGSNTNFTPGRNPMMEAHKLVALEIEENSVGLSTVWFPKTSNASFLFAPENVTLADSMCKETMPFVQVKSQYWAQLVYPTIGEPVRVGTFGPAWEFFRTPMYAADNMVFAIYRQRDFCMLAYKCKSLMKEE